MSTTAALFARWIAAKGYSSERQALKALKLSPGAAVHWKAGRNADADIIEKMARDLDENAGELIALAMAEQAKGEAARTWARLAKQLGAAAAVAAVAVVALPVLQAHDGSALAYLPVMIMRTVHYAQLMLPAIVLAVIAFVGFRGNRRNARMLPL